MIELAKTSIPIFSPTAAVFIIALREDLNVRAKNGLAKLKTILEHNKAI